ncbi:hypothetical protein BH11PAT1_BH11PAT1_1950 [soil metagenome]
MDTKRRLSFLGIAVLLAGLVTTITVVKQSQTLQQHAASDTSFHVTRIGKIIGSRGPTFVTTSMSTRQDPSTITVLNDTFRGVTASDLGAMTAYKGKLYFNLGDTAQTSTSPSNPDFIRSVVPFSSDTNFADGITLENYLPCAPEDTNCTPTKVINGNYPLPNAMFSINWQGQEYMFSQYMEHKSGGGHDLTIHYSAIAKYDEGSRQFTRYKENVYTWPGDWQHFGMASFWVDYSTQYLYMIGSPAGRLGGAKLARIPLSTFMDTGNMSGWEYFLGSSQWSGPTQDKNTILSAAWLIPPKSPDWSINKDWTQLSYDEKCRAVTISEFSVIYNPYLQKFVLITGRPCETNSNGGVFFYTADNIMGPWSNELLLLANQTEGGINYQYYGTYTTDALLRNNGQTMYFVATNWTTYGIYLYKVDFSTLAPTIAPSPTPLPTNVPTVPQPTLTPTTPPPPTITRVPTRIPTVTPG